MGRFAAVLRSYVGVLVFSGFIALGAGTVWLWPIGRYVILAMVGTTLNHLLLPAGSTLTQSRYEKAGAGEAWDRRLLGLHFLVNLVGFVLAGVDLGRLSLSPAMPAVAVGVGCVGMVVGQLLFALARRENRYFSSTVQVQEGHTVCDTGLYRIVRHPGNLGMVLLQLTFPLVIGSGVTMGPALLGVGLLLVRTAKEDALLRASLAGYAAYAERVRWRLLPGLY